MRPGLRGAGVALAMLVSLPVAIAAISLHARAARARRATEQPAIEELAPRLPTSDLALSGGARWLRAPSLEEPGAAFADGPALPDPDPAGGAMAPPREVWAKETVRHR
jgi:hypothetical protein